MSFQTSSAAPGLDHQPTSPRKRCGFTAIELLATSAVIGVVSSLIIPAVLAVREAARQTHCKSNLQRIGLALHNYHETHTLFPYASTVSFPAQNRFTDNKHVWTELLLPFLDQAALHQRIDFSIPVDAGANRVLLEGRKLPIFACPSNPYAYSLKNRDGGYFGDWGVTDANPGLGPTQGLAYPLCAGSILPDHLTPDCTAGYGSFCISEKPGLAGGPSWWHAHSAVSPGIFNRGITNTRRDDITDGLSNTFLAAERNAEECCLGGVFSWNSPVFFTGQKLNSKTRDTDVVHYFQNCGTSSHHQGGGHFLFADNSVRFITDAIDFKPFCYYGDKADGMIRDDGR